MWLTRNYRTTANTAYDMLPGDIADITGDGWGVRVDRIEHAEGGLIIHTSHDNPIIQAHSDISGDITPGDARVILFMLDRHGLPVPNVATRIRAAARAARRAALGI